LWCPSKSAPSLSSFAASSHFAINVLASHQHHLSRQFSTQSDDKFEGVDVMEGLAGLPLLPQALATFECRTVARHDAGDHVILVGEVERYAVTEGSPLVFHSGRYQLMTTHPDV
jgi:flavin reductase (DIM6/NTAB) family NADH-FMN oxidoreductase RutF